MAFRGPVGEKILSKLTAALSPTHLEVLNESHMHSVPKNSETHFKVVCVSDKFDGKTLIENHRLINGLLKKELEDGVHALSLILKTPKQWSASQSIPESPKCRGGSKHDG
jgi:stress-induced morphogen